MRTIIKQKMIQCNCLIEKYWQVWRRTNRVEYTDEVQRSSIAAVGEVLLL